MGAKERRPAKRARVRWSSPTPLLDLVVLPAFAVGLTVIGLVMIGAGVTMVNEISALSSRGRYASGTVLAHRENPGPTGTGIRINVGFTTSDRTRYTFWESGRTPVGESVRVRYDPRNPRNASTRSSNFQRAEGLILAGFGPIAAIGGLYLLARILREVSGERRAPG
jgi:hypothetical protein